MFMVNLRKRGFFKQSEVYVKFTTEKGRKVT